MSAVPTKPSLWKRIQGKALWYSFVAQKLWWMRQEPGLFPVNHGKLFIEPREGWRAFLRAHDAWEPEVIEKLYSIVRPGDHVLDLGSNYGEFALQLADLVGKEGKVVGVEMDPHYVTILQLIREYNPHLKERFTIIPRPLTKKNDLKGIIKETGITPTFYFSDIEGAESLLVEQVFADPKLTKDNPRFLLELHPEIYGEDTKKTILEKFTNAGYHHEAVDYKHYYFWR